MLYDPLRQFMDIIGLAGMAAAGLGFAYAISRISDALARTESLAATAAADAAPRQALLLANDNAARPHHETLRRAA